MAEQLKVYESDFEKERAQREKLFAENDILKTKNILLLQESSTVVTLQQVSSFELVWFWYLKTIEQWLADSAWGNNSIHWAGCGGGGGGGLTTACSAGKTWRRTDECFRMK